MPVLPATADGRYGTRTRRGPWRLKNKLVAGPSGFDGRRTVRIRAGIPKDTSNLCFPHALPRRRCPTPTPTRTPSADTSSRWRQPAREIGATLHQLVTTGGVKKALTIGEADR